MAHRRQGRLTIVNVKNAAMSRMAFVFPKYVVTHLRPVLATIILIAFALFVRTDHKELMGFILGTFQVLTLVSSIRELVSSSDERVRRIVTSVYISIVTMSMTLFLTGAEEEVYPIAASLLYLSMLSLRAIVGFLHPHPADGSAILSVVVTGILRLTLYYTGKTFEKSYTYVAFALTATVMNLATVFISKWYLNSGKDGKPQVILMSSTR